MSSLMRQLWGRGGSEEAKTPAEDFRPEGATPPPSSKGGSGELEGLRLLVFRDAWEWGERRLLFDSSQSPRPSTSPTPQSPTTPLRLEMAEKLRETKMLGEMVFGSVSIAFKGNTIKLHNYRDGGLVVSKVFSSRRKSSLNTSAFPPSICEKGGMEYSSDSDSQYSTVNSLSGLVVGAASTPLDVPERLFRSPTSSLGSGVGTGTGTGTIAGSIPSRSASAAAISETLSLSGSPISRSLRLRTAQTFSLDQGVSGRRSRKAASEGSSATCTERRKSAQLGLAVILGRGEGDADAWRRFLFAHMALLETELWALQGSVEAAAGERANFVGKVWLGWERFRGRLGQLFWGHRLAEPVWSSLRSYEESGAREKAANLRRRFAATFVRLARLADTKERNFFLSNLVTGVLGEHGTWVGSVAPASAARPFLRQMAAQTRQRRGGPGEPLSPPSPPPQPIPTPEITITRQGSLNEREDDSSIASSSHLPYNPLGAQYSELRGRIGDSSSGGQASVLLTGSDAELVREFLFLLSYFIRCSQVRSAEASAQALPASDELASERLFVPGPILPTVLPDLPTPSPPRPDFIPLQRQSAELVGGGGGGGPSSPEKRPRPPSPLVTEMRPRSDSLLGLRGSLAAAGLKDAEEIAAPSVIQINQRRFEVRTVPDSAISAPTGGFIGGMGGAARAHHLRPGPLSPKKRYQHQRRPQAQPEPIHPSSSQPEVWTEPLPPLVCEPLDLEKYPKLRKVSASALGKMAPGLNLEEEKVSPAQQHLSSDGDSGGCSSGGEDTTRTVIPDQSRQPRSLDSGIAEADALNLMEASGRKAPSPPNPTTTSTSLHLHLHPHLVSTHSSVLGPSLETEEFVGEKESVAGAEAEAATEELGRSLFGGYLSSYSPHFVLAGCPPKADLIPTILEDLGASAQSEEGAEEEADEESHSVCVLGSTDQWSVRILSSKLGVRPALVPSQIVLRGVEAALSLADLGASPEFVLHSLEETLGEIWRKSLGLAGAVEAAGKGDGEGQWLEMEELVSLAGVDWADLPLLFSVAGLHSHRLLASLSAQS